MSGRVYPCIALTESVYLASRAPLHELNCSQHFPPNIPPHIQTCLEIIFQKGTDANDMMLFHDTSVYAIAAGGVCA